MTFSRLPAQALLAAGAMLRRSLRDTDDGMTFRCALTLIAATTCSLAVAATGQSASGRITYQSDSGPLLVDVKHAFLIKGPSTLFATTIRQVVISTEDVSATLRKCKEMALCSPGDADAIVLNFDTRTPFLPYWFVANKQGTQYSGTAGPASVRLTTDTPERLAGTWELPAGGSGPALKLTFDAPLINEMTK
jgi:hypothetical protein